MDSPRSTVDRFLRRYLLAVQAATRMPVRGAAAGWIGSTPDMQRAAAPHLPGAGWIVGMAACVSFAVVSLLLPDTGATAFAAAVACCLATAALTGAGNEEGLAQFAAAARAGAPAPHLATIALVLVLALKISLLAVLASRSPGAVLTALLAAHTLSRFWPLLLESPLPRRQDILTAAAWCVVPLALMALAHGLSFMLLALAGGGLTIAGLRVWRQKAGRAADADALAAAQQLCEVATYLCAGFGLPSR